MNEHQLANLEKIVVSKVSSASGPWIRWHDAGSFAVCFCWDAFKVGAQPFYLYPINQTRFVKYDLELHSSIPVYRNASKRNKCIIDEYDTMSMSNFAVFEWKGPQVANTVAQRYEIVSGCVASFRGGLFTSSCLCTHAARPRALSPRDERYAPFFLPFVSVFPVEWYVCTPERVSKLSTSLFEKVCEPPRNRTSKIPAFCDTTTVSLAHIVPPSFATLLSKLFLSGPTVHRSECASPPPLCSSRRRGVVFGPRFAFETAMLSWLSRPQFHHQGDLIWSLLEIETGMRKGKARRKFSSFCFSSSNLVSSEIFNQWQIFRFVYF